MNKKKPTRSCIACRIKNTQEKLLRIGYNNEKIYFGKGNGRGVYLCYDENCAELAKKKNSIAKSIKCSSDMVNFNEILNEILKQKENHVNFDE